LNHIKDKEMGVVETFFYAHVRQTAGDENEVAGQKGVHVRPRIYVEGIAATGQSDQGKDGVARQMSYYHTR
jgi:hypothetical protein